MKKVLLIIMAGILLITSCTPLKRAQTGMARAIAGSVTTNIDGNEVYCSEGKVCAEVDVLSIAAEDRDGGKVRVTLKNRTGNTALIQIHLQIKDKTTGEVLAETRPENVAIPGTQEKTYEMKGISKKGAVVRVIMNTAY